MNNCDEIEKQKKAEQIILLEEKREELTAQLKDCYLQLGREVYEITENKAKEIHRLLERLIDTKVKHSALKELHLCLNCMTQNPSSHRFCCHCGQKITEE